MIGQVLDGSSSMSRAATTTTTVTIEPTERSNSPDTITKYWPAARMASGAARLRNARKPGGSRKFGFSIAMSARRMNRTMKIGAVPISALRMRSARLVTGASKLSAVVALMPCAPIGGRRRRRPR